MSQEYRHSRARFAVLTRYRDPGDPELIDAHRRMREAALIAAIGRALDNSLPLTAELQARITAMLIESQVGP